MTFAWLKNYMPRSLYGRAALILILPVVVLQLAVSVVFVQRHFAGVTSQMTRNIVYELGFVFDQIESAQDMSAGLAAAGPVARPLRMSVAEVQTPIQDLRHWYDFTGITVLQELHDSTLPVTGTDLQSRNRSTVVGLETRHGLIEVEFRRQRISASNPHQLLVLTVIIGVLMTVISFLFLRNQLRPINRLAQAATAFGRGQTVPYKPSGAIEVREAGHSFLNMRARIDRHIEQRTLMLSGVSHDLRTPLTRLRLEFSTQVMDRTVRIIVEDNGPGIPPDKRDEALRPFTRLEASRNQNQGSGVGLGLAITNDIARSHGGVLRLGESSELGGLKVEFEVSR